LRETFFIVFFVMLNFSIMSK